MGAPDDTLRVLRIERGTTVDGPGFRTSIYLAGCTHACPGCHNPTSWSFSGGEVMSIDEVLDVVREEDFNVTLTGGDPLCSPHTTRLLATRIREAGYTLWIYTGYTWEKILASPRLLDIVRLADVVVEGPFVESLRDTDLRFRGSSNQRMIRVAESLASGIPVLYT